MKEEYRTVRVGVIVFRVLAWLSLLIQGAAGIALLVTGGARVPVGDADVPARVVGVVFCLAAGLYFFLLLLIANVLKLLLEVRGRLDRSSSA